MTDDAASKRARYESMRQFLIGYSYTGPPIPADDNELELDMATIAVLTAIEGMSMGMADDEIMRDLDSALARVAVGHGVTP